MKKKISLAIGALAGAVVLGLGIYHTDASQTEPKLSVDQIRQLVSEQYPGTITEMELEKDFNKVVYEIEIEGNGKKYDLTLDGNSGEVLKIHEKTFIENKVNNESNLVVKEKENTEKENNAKQESTNTADKKVEKNVTDNNAVKVTEKKTEKAKVENNAKSNQKVVINRDEASKIALNTFTGKITEIELDEDDGRLIYEIEIKAGEQEADIEIDAYTGEVLVIEIDD